MRVLSFFAVAALGIGSSDISAQLNDRPNIVLILADDMGFSDVGCYGSEIPTPNIDALAANGLRFTQFRNSARCSPTRAALLTGLDPHQTGMGILAGDEKKSGGSSADPLAGPGYIQHLNDRCVTLAEVLRTAGYHTYMAGKWHIGAFEKWQWPLQRGFEKYYGVLAGTVSYFKPTSPRPLYEGNEELPPPDPAHYYTTDAFAENAVRFIHEQKDDAPFFLYLAFNAPHYPLHAPSEDIKKFVGHYRAGWDELRRERFARQQKLGLFSDHTSLSPRDPVVRAWSAFSPEEQIALDYRMAVYAAQVHRMDLNVGRLVAALRERGQLDNTLLIFLSDNGPSREPGPDTGGGKMKNINDPEKRGSNDDDGSSYGAGWANLSATPYRGFKAQLLEGGIATPLIVHWPNGLRTKPGSFTPAPSYLTDIMPTLLEITGAKYAAPAGRPEPFKLEGWSLAPVLAGKSSIPREWTFFEQYGNDAVRFGKWKAVLQGNVGKKWTLYNLSIDPTELEDVGDSNPALLKEMIAAWERWANSHQVLPKKISKS